MDICDRVSDAQRSIRIKRVITYVDSKVPALIGIDETVGHPPPKPQALMKFHDDCLSRLRIIICCCCRHHRNILDGSVAVQEGCDVARIVSQVEKGKVGSKATCVSMGIKFQVPNRVRGASIPGMVHRGVWGPSYC